MSQRHKQASRTERPFDYTTASLAAIALGSALVLGACGPDDDRGTPTGRDTVVAAQPVPPATPPATAAAPLGAAKPVSDTPRVPVAAPTLGQVTQIDTLTERPKGSGVGAVAGGVLGGVVGHQIGSGDGNTLATAAGAVGGAVLGNKIERDRATKVVGYRVQVRLDNGQSRSFTEPRLDGLHVGDRVRVEGGQLRRA